MLEADNIVEKIKAQFSLLQEVTGITKLSVSVEIRHLWPYTEEMQGLTH